VTAKPGVRTLSDRRIAWLGPLVAIFGAAAALVVWQATQRQSPTIFSDELELTQISRAIAEYGVPKRRDVTYEFTTLAPWLTAPFWRIGSVASAYEAIRVFQAVVMAAAVFPAYGIARYVVSRPWALVAAALSVGVPALAYAPILKEEPFGYTASAVAVLLLMRFAASPRGATCLAALAAAGLAAAIRTQLSVLIGVWALAVAIAVWRSTGMRHRRAGWKTIEWVLAGLALLVVLVAGYAAATVASTEIDKATTEQLGQAWEYGIWAIGAWAIGLGMAPAVGLLAALARPRAALAVPRVRAFVTVSALTTAAIVAYAAVKAAAVSSTLGPLIVERNVIYLTPLAAASIVCILTHRDSPWWSIVAATAAVTFLVTRTPLELRFPYYESHGVAIMSWAVTELGWTPESVRTARWIVALGAGAILLVLCFPRRIPTQVAGPIAGALVAATLAWGITAEIHADRGERAFAANFASRTPEPRTWVDEATNGERVTMLGQQMGPDPTVLWLTEFWNRGIVHVWSVDGTAPGPGPTLTPNLAKIDGTLGSNAETPYALALPGIDLAGEVVAENGGFRVLRLRDGVLRLRSSQSGVGEGSWTGPTASFNRFEAPAEPTVAVLTLGRAGFCADVPLPSEVRVRVGRIAIGSDKQAAIGTLTGLESLRVTPCRTVTMEFPVPDGPWRIEIESDTFVPADVDSKSTDPRSLGVQVSLTTRLA
jgi:Dolichyl-phosphate-mannose-protein mannosyltransferase